MKKLTSSRLVIFAIVSLLCGCTPEGVEYHNSYMFENAEIRSIACSNGCCEMFVLPSNQEGAWLHGGPIKKGTYEWVEISATYTNNKFKDCITRTGALK